MTQLPAIVYDVYIGCQQWPANDFGHWPYVQIWERTGTRLDYNRLVFSLYNPANQLPTCLARR